MFYGHDVVPDYLCVGQLPKTKNFSLQIVGALSARCGAQCSDMDFNGFFPDTSSYLLMTKGCRTIAWLGFSRHSTSGIVTIKQIQGRKGCENLPNDWTLLLLRSFVESLDRSCIHTAKVLPARLSAWWGADNALNREALRGRLITYYVRVPKPPGFELADIEAQKLFLNMIPEGESRYRFGVPCHTLTLER